MVDFKAFGNNAAPAQNGLATANGIAAALGIKDASHVTMGGTVAINVPNSPEGRKYAEDLLNFIKNKAGPGNTEQVHVVPAENGGVDLSFPRDFFDRKAKDRNGEYKTPMLNAVGNQNARPPVYPGEKHSQLDGPKHRASLKTAEVAPKQKTPQGPAAHQQGPQEKKVAVRRVNHAPTATA